MNAEVQTPLIAHLIELKTRMARAVVVWLLATIICYCYAPAIYAFLVEPLHLAFAGNSRQLIATALTETFVTYIRLALYAGFFIAFPVIATQAYLFIAPGLYKREKRALLPYLFAAPLLFFAGAAFAYYVLIPKAWQFFIGFEQPDAALPLILQAKVSEYLGLVLQLVTAFGLSFQLPIVLTLLVRVGLLKTTTLTRGRRYAVVILLTIAAIITPPDILSQVVLFIPLYALYELSILIARAIERRQEERELYHA